MKDPFPFQPSPAVKRGIDNYLSRVADPLNLVTLYNHSHEILVAFLFYNFIYNRFSPWISTRIFPRTYPNLPPKTRLNWDIHVVSLVQSLLICCLAVWVMVANEERKVMGQPENWPERIWGYDGSLGLISALACGYFIWDLGMSAYHFDIFGFGILAHAISALTVFSLGFRPFVNYYAPTFILYELSTPFLNVHWFCDKLNLTGSRLQLINGIVLLGTFFGCRLVWGTYSSVQVFSDVYRALRAPESELDQYIMVQKAAVARAGDGAADVMAYSGDMYLPVWLGATYLASNIVLNSLNFFWFHKMIQTIRKRFDPPFGTRRPEKKDADVGAKDAGATVLVAQDVNPRAAAASGRKAVEVTVTRRSVQQGSLEDVAGEFAEAMGGMAGDDKEIVGGL